MAKKTTIGGQALIEGIMMKGPKKTAIAVRMADGSIDVSFMPEKHIREKFKILGWPIIRGTVVFAEAMVSGYKALMFSADKSGFTDLEEKEIVANNDKELDVEKAETVKPEVAQTVQSETHDVLETKSTVVSDSKDKKESALMAAVMIIGSVLGFSLALVLFMWLPAFIFNVINNATGDAISGWRSVIEGIMKISIFVAYISCVTLMGDIKRVFMYHGSEHKTIFCYESGEELTVANVRKQKRFHPRCGTSFLILMLLIGIIINGLIATIFPIVTKYIVIWVAVKILMIPLVCGLGYELIKICGRYENLATKIISAPGLWLQRLTTKEPDDTMIEVAIASLKAVIPENPDDDKWQ